MSETATELTGWDVKMRKITEAAEVGATVVCEWTTNPSRGFSEAEVSRSGEVGDYDPDTVYIHEGREKMRLRKSGAGPMLERQTGNGTWTGVTDRFDSVTIKPE